MLLLIWKIACHLGCNEIEDAHSAVEKMYNLIYTSRLNFQKLKRFDPVIDTTILELSHRFSNYEYNQKICHSLELIVKCAIRITFSCFEGDVLMDKLVCIADHVSAFPAKYRVYPKVLLCIRTQDEVYEDFKQNLLC